MRSWGGVIEYFPMYNLSLTHETLHVSPYSILISMVNVLTSYIHWFDQFRPSQLRTAMPDILEQIIPIRFVFY